VKSGVEFCWFLGRRRRGMSQRNSHRWAVFD
jgi:hypothetical protein